jgi:YD repeat-containing protein
MLDNVLTVIDSSGRFAKVSGRVMPVGTTTANTLWVLATAYDSAGNVVGIRRWDSPSAVAPDSPLAFDFLVSSVGAGIARVELLSEARP